MGGEGMGDDLCIWLLKHLSEYLDLELRTEACTRLESHMVECPSCRALVSTMRGTVGIVQDLSSHTIPPECLRRIRERVFERPDQA
jgi:predicted anti-sigma-YlaC factor YlaD